MTEKRTVAMLVFDDVEVLDFAGPFEVFSLAGFDVQLVAPAAGPVTARNGLSINPHASLEECDTGDILLVPGGFGTRALMQEQPVLDWIATMAQYAELTLSVCTGALLLARAGLLEEKIATTHYQAYDELRRAAPTALVRENERVVDNGEVLCSAGVSAGIDLAFHVVARLLGRRHAEHTASYMEYDWHPDSRLAAQYHA